MTRILLALAYLAAPLASAAAILALGRALGLE